MSRVARWIPALLAVGLVAGAVETWRLEGAVPVSTTGGPSQVAVTPVLSVRRLPGVLAAPVAARRLRIDLAALTAFLPDASCLVVDGPSALRYEWHGDASLVPASNQKLLTATAALDALGRSTRFRTKVVGPPLGAGGVVVGDLTLVGGGDPILATADYVARFRNQPQTFTDLDGLAGKLWGVGVRQVTGSVVGDESRYDTARQVAGWPARYAAQNVIGPLSALSVNDGFATYPTTLGGGTLEAAPAPAVDAAGALTRLLEARGIDVVGEAREGAAPPGSVELATIESPPMVEVVGQMLRESDNNTAELLTKEIGHRAGDPTTAGGTAVIEGVAAGELGRGVHVADGSGLSLDDRVTCALLVDLLERPGTGSTVVDGLAVAGRSGTLAERFVGTPLVDVLQAKTGSLTSVTALSGVVHDADPPLTFALVVNAAAPTPVPPGVAALQERVAETLLAWPRAPDVSRLGPVVAEG